ncbi:MAG: heme-binding domain-containing protein [Bryobacteraceae bacterium]
MRKLYIALGVAAILVGGAQLVRPSLSNPAADPGASFLAVARSPKAAEILNRSCGDCHSHQTVWPWYSQVAPASWLLASDVNEGRARLNLSEWNRYSAEMSAIRMKQICAEVSRGEMPPWYYAAMHPAAKLSQADKAVLCAPPPAP